MEDGLPAKREYRRFKVATCPATTTSRPWRRCSPGASPTYLEERDKPVAERGRFAYPPQLLLVDGGKGQLASAVRVLEDLGLDEEIPVASLAKRFEEVYVPGRSDPVQLPRQSEALYLLQRIRDEAHRFAITYHRAAARQAHDQVGARRRPRARADPQEAAREGARRGAGGEGGQHRRRSAALSWLPDAVADAVHGKIHSVGARPARRPPSGV